MPFSLVLPRVSSENCLSAQLTEIDDLPVQSGSTGSFSLMELCVKGIYLDANPLGSFGKKPFV